MDLQSELNRQNPFPNIDVEILVSAVYLSKCINKLSAEYFSTLKFEQDGQTYGLTDMQYNALVILRDRKGLETLQTELSERLVINKSSAGVLLDKLESRGWITRKAKDRRANLVTISPRGEEILAQVLPVVDDYCSKMVDGFSDDDKTQLLELLGRYRQQIRSVDVTT